MTAPALSRRLTLETRVATPDGAGGFAIEWQALGQLWADVRTRSKQEDVIGGQPRSRVTYRIVVRAAPFGAPSRPRADQRFREGTRVFDILAVAEKDERFLEILAEEGVAQ